MGPEFAISITTATFTTVITLASIWNHLKSYKRPDLQRHIVRIILMPLIYGVSSCLAFGFPRASHYLEPIRDCYEAFVLWMFFQLLVNYMGGERELLLRLDDGRMPVGHPWPFNWCLIPLDLSFPSNVVMIKRGILQFVVVKPLHALLVIILRSCDLYDEGVISYDTAYVYLALMYNISVCVSMYCLVLFYMVTSNDLAPYKPMFKFLCIKAVIFFSFWQGLLISILVKIGAIHDSGSAASIQNFIICLEMLIASIAHAYAFPSSEFRQLPSSRLPLSSAFRDVVGFNDLLLEARYTLRGTDFRIFNESPLSGRGFRRGNGDDEEGGNDSARPLLGHAGGRLVRAYTGLRFEDDDDRANDTDVEQLFESARQFKDGDYNYRVIDTN